MDRFDVMQILNSSSCCKINKFMSQHWNCRTFSYRDRPRPDHGILFVTRGKILFESAEDRLAAEAGDAIFLPEGSRYEAVIRPEFGHTQDYLINFEVETGAISGTPVKLLHTADPWYLELFERMVDEKLRGMGSGFRVKGQFFLLLDKIYRDQKNGGDPDKDRLLRRARELLTDKTELSVRQIAGECGISESGLRSCFARAYGCSPQQYRMQAKISKAKFLLESTDLSVYAIAETLDFYDEAYFCKMFRKYVGCSPKKYLQEKSL